MNKEELVNLNMKDIILDKWKGKLSYPFRQIDLEELENIINYYEEENNQLKEQYCERIDCTGRLGNSKKVEELIKKNEKLKEENFNLREGIYIEKMSFPSEGRNFKELIEMPTYEELNQENQQLKEKLEKCIPISEQIETIDRKNKRIEELQEENEKLNHYKLLYQKVKDRNDKAIDMLDLIIPELWNINNNMTYKIKKVMNILKGNNE